MSAEVPPRTIDVLFSNPDVVVVNKPSGLLVHRGWDRDDDVVMFRVRDALGVWVHPVHRLDRGTSGAVAFALSPEAARHLCEAFEGGRVEKRYLALVRGHLREDEGVIDYPIQNKEEGPRVPAVTRFRCVGRSTVDRCSLVMAYPETGRLHQVRRHLRHIDHPLVGDVKHGSGAVNRHYRATYGLHRLALHARYVAFDAPNDQGRVEVVAPIPEDLATPLRQLGLYEAACVA